jgi:hypothetical protein
LLGYITISDNQWRALVPEETSLTLLIKASDKGYLPAQFNLGLRYLFESGFDREEGLRLVRSAAEGGYFLAARRLARYLRTPGELRGLLNVDVAPDAREHVRFLLVAAEQGDPWAMAALSRRYRMGSGVPRSTEEEAKWLKRCLDTGCSAHRRPNTATYEQSRVAQLYDRDPLLFTPLGKWKPTARCHRWVPDELHAAAVQVMLCCRFRLGLPPYVALCIVSYLITAQ